ncbi:cytochrome c3 family protein [Aestuariivirga sp.]|uniref:cytochrome c3 family protein n=1 Tax=Aestuariivirga sp. TaxID=2650926 RepID=UPI003919A546
MAGRRLERLVAAAFFALMAAGPARGAAEASFSGSKVCAECHAAEAAEWAESDHAWALKAPGANSVLGDFGGATFTHKGITSRFFTRGGGYFVETEGVTGRLETFEIRYTVGHRPLQQYLVETSNGRLQVLDLAWDVKGGKWFHLYPDQDAPPGDGMHWTGTYKNWQARCAECHQTGFDKGYDLAKRAYQSHWAELTAGCESCHGPGSAHVDAARRPDSGNPHQSFLPKLGRGQQENEINACGPCHARREAFAQAAPPAGSAFHDHYALSLLTPDLYFGDGQQNAEVFILGSFLQSKMKARGVTCSDCHAPHSGKLVAEGNAVCTQCHGEAGRPEFPSLRKADYDQPAHHRHRPGSEAAQCVSCHMPERSYMLIDPRRDHFFRMPDPIQAEAAGAPDACTTCHEGKTPAWAAERIAEWFPAGDRSWQDRSAIIAFQRGEGPEKAVQDLVGFIRDTEKPGIARATAVSILAGHPALGREQAEALLQDDDALLRAATAAAIRHLPPEERIALLRPLLSDARRSVRQTAATELAGAGVAVLPAPDDEAYRAAMREFLNAKLANADTPESHMAIGGFALTRRQWDEAEKAFGTAAEIDPQMAEAWLMLARIGEARGEPQKAEAALAAGTTALPRSADLAIARAEFEARRGATARAIDWYRRALGIDQGRAEAWFGLGLAGLSAGNTGLALDAARRAGKLRPEDPMPLVLEAMALDAEGRAGEARKTAERVRALAPGLQLPAELEALLRTQP